MHQRMQSWAGELPQLGLLSKKDAVLQLKSSTIKEVTQSSKINRKFKKKSIITEKNNSGLQVLHGDMIRVLQGKDE